MDGNIERIKLLEKRMEAAEKREEKLLSIVEGLIKEIDHYYKQHHDK